MSRASGVFRFFAGMCYNRLSPVAAGMGRMSHATGECKFNDEAPAAFADA